MNIYSRVPFVDIAGQQVLHPFVLFKVPTDKLAIDGINAAVGQCCSHLGTSSTNQQNFCYLETVGVLKVSEANRKGPVPRLAPGPYHYCLAGT